MDSWLRGCGNTVKETTGSVQWNWSHKIMSLYDRGSERNKQCHDFLLKLPRWSILLMLFGCVIPGLSRRRSGFYPRAVRVGFVVYRVAIGQDVYRVTGFPLSVWVACPGILFGEEEGFNKFSWGHGAERTVIWGLSPPARGSGGNCNLVQEISFHIVKFS